MGEPEDVVGQCNARLFIGDNYGDNHATMRCELDPRHEGMHREEYGHDSQSVVVSWAQDERNQS